MVQISTANKWLSVHIEADVYERAARLATESEESVPNQLYNMGELSQAQLSAYYHDTHHLTFWSHPDIDQAVLDLSDVIETPACFKANDWLVLGAREGIWVVIARDPLRPEPHAYLSASQQHAEIHPVVASGFRHAEKLVERRGIDSAKNGTVLGAEQIREIAQQGPIVQLVSELIDTACANRASDIHFEPSASSFKVRQRIDGVLHELESLDPRVELAVLSRIKILGGLDIAERRLPQDGRFSHYARNEEVDVRVSVLPLAEGESAVLRLLRQHGTQFGLTELGVSDVNRQVLSQVIDKTSGVLLVTGPTGAGKTTTLYALLKLLNKPDVKIISLEDPVEYDVDGINQVQVNSDIGFTFSTGLRSILRQDPDILMVGEIRDGETAQIALQAALTGHLVVSTVHTNDALSAITRLLDLGVPEYLINAGLVGVAGQRLVRTLCKNCRLQAPPTDAQLELFQTAGLAAPEFLYHHVGCPSCGGTGYVGRQMIMEAFAINETLRDMPKGQGFHSAASAYISNSGSVTMMADGLLKASAGETTVEEVLRVAG